MSETRTDPQTKRAEEKADQARAALKESVLAFFEDGKRDGLRPSSVRALEQGLVTLGWLPADLKR